VAAEPVRQVRLLAEAVCHIEERSEPRRVARREAAASDPAVAASLDTAHRLRLETIRAVIGMLPEDQLRSTPGVISQAVRAAFIVGQGTAG
jgi:hypothetical protein